MNSLRSPPGTPTTSLPFHASGSRSTQRASGSSAMPPATCRPGTARVSGVRYGASGDTACASVRGVNADGGSPARELSCGVVSAFAVVRSALTVQSTFWVSASSASLIWLQASWESAGAASAASRAMATSRMAFLRGCCGDLELRIWRLSTARPCTALVHFFRCLIRRLHLPYQEDLGEGTHETIQFAGAGHGARHCLQHHIRTGRSRLERRHGAHAEQQAGIPRLCDFEVLQRESERAGGRSIDGGPWQKRSGRRRTRLCCSFGAYCSRVAPQRDPYELPCGARHHRWRRLWEALWPERGQERHRHRHRGKDPRLRAYRVRGRRHGSQKRHADGSG